MAKRQSSDPLERYDTPAWMTRTLLARVPIFGDKIFEPCAGTGAIASVVCEEAGCVVIAKDIEPRASWILKGDTLTNTDHWPTHPIGIITNTPFSRVADCVRLAVSERVPFVIALARLTFLERTADRDDIPDPDFAIVLPRIKPWFMKTGTDSCTVAWFGWIRPGDQQARLMVRDTWPDGIIRIGKAEARSRFLPPRLTQVRHEA
jgi:hypothetical protein